MNNKFVNLILPYRSKRREWVKKIYFKLTKKSSIKDNHKVLKLNLGCGKVYLNGWVNIDIESGIADVNTNLTKGLPYKDNSVGMVYNEHFIEHLEVKTGVMLLKECHRVLKKDGIIRIATLDLDYLCFKYFFSWKKQDWIKNRGYRHIQTKAEMMNTVFREWGHQWIYNDEELSRRLKEAGFRNIRRVKLNKSNNPVLNNLETRKDSKLILEAVK